MSSGQIPVSFTALAAKQGQADANKAIARQITAEDRFQANAESSYNSMAGAKAQALNDRFKKLEDRHVSATGKDTDEDDLEVEAVAATEQKAEEDLAQSFFKRNSELPPSKLQDLKASLKESSSEQEIFEKVSKAFEDPTLMDEALDYLEQATTGPLRGKISHVRQLLNQENEREIIAGKNIDAAAKDYAARGLAPTATDLRNLYRDITGNPRDHETLFDELSTKYTFDNLKEIVKFLLQGMAFDMKSKGPSIPGAELIKLMSETRDLQSILWVYLFFKERMKMIRNQYKRHEMQCPENLSFEKLAKGFMKLVKERYPSVMKILKEADDLALFDDDEKVIVLSQFRDAIRGLSPRVYKSIKHRQELLLALLETLDQLEWEEELEE